MAQLEDEKKRKSHLKEVIYILIWIGIIVKIFIIDWDVQLIRKFLPSCEWILNYKILILLLIITLTSKMKPGKIVWNILYFLFLPLIILFGYIPFKIFLVTKWNGIISYFNAILSFFNHFGFKISLAITYICGLVFILNYDNNILTVVSIVINVFIIICLIRAIYKLAFSNSVSYNFYKKIVDMIMKRNTKTDDEEYEKIETLNELKNNEQIFSLIQGRVLLNRILLFASKKFKEYNDGKSYIFHNIIILIFFTFIGVLSLSIINYGLYKLNELNYSVTSNVNIIDFVLYTLNSSNGIICANSFLTKLLQIVMLFLFFVFTACLVCTFLEQNKARQKEEIEKVIDSLEKMAKYEEMKITNKNFFENINDAIQGLNQLKGSLAALIIEITEKLGE